MNEKKALFILITLTLIQVTVTVNGLTPGDYHEKFWGGGLNVWVHYPEEAEPGDSITVNVYIVSGKFPRGNHVGEVKAKISVLTTTSTAILHDTTLILDTYMQSGSVYNQSIPITLPSDARWFMTIQIDTVSYQNDLTNRQEAHVTLDATTIRTSTYSDLQQQIQELQAYSAQLGQQNNELQNQLDLYQSLDTGEQELVDEYLQLQDAFDELFAMHEDNIQYIEDFEVMMADTINEKDSHIEELDAGFSELFEDNLRLEAEVEAAVSELEDYLELNATHSEFEAEDEIEVVTDYFSRNIFIGTTILSLAAAVALYIKYKGIM